MKLIVLLVVLALRRLELSLPEWLTGHDRLERLLRPYWDRLGKADAAWHWWLAVLLPSLIVAWVFYWLGQPLLGLLAWLAGASLLLWLWGGESEFRQVDAMLAHGRMQDWSRLEAIAKERFQVTQGEDFFVRLQGQLLFRDARILFASIFWLVLLGYWAVFLYLINHLYLRLFDNSAARLAQVVQDVLFYPVARLLVLCLALVADFQRVMVAVEGEFFTGNSRTLLNHAIKGALSHIDIEAEGENARGVERLGVLQTILLRCMALWLVMAAVWILLIY